MTSSWIHELVSIFGSDAKAKLRGDVGQPEAAIRKPLDVLVTSIGKKLDLKVVAFDEVSDVERNVRPDYAIQVNGAITGYLEVKAPGENLDPAAFKGHNLRQWERLKDIPNLLYTNGIEWRLWHAGEPAGDPGYLMGGTLNEAGGALLGSDRFEVIVNDFLRWEPLEITSVRKLVSTVAPLTRLLRGEVLDTLAAERRAINSPGGKLSHQLFLGMANEWKSLLFPGADDAEFADGYAQTVTFALLLAKSEGIDIGSQSLHSTADRLGESHGLMAKALQLLTDDVSKDFRVTLNLMIRTINAVNWKRIRAGVSDMYLHLYEHFLAAYDNELRKESGSYYTPTPVVQEMTRLTEDVLERRLGKALKFRDPNVSVIDPAMGTGTFPLQIMERAANQAAQTLGPGAASEAINSVARRLYGFELQTGPYSVAELRLTDLMKSYNATFPQGGLNLYVADTLEDPFGAVKEMSYVTQLVAKQRRQANAVKATTNVTVCIGNPPYNNYAEGKGGWVENGSRGDKTSANDKGEGILKDFRLPGNGPTEFVLKTMYAYFWRWAFWKVFESTPQPGAFEGDSGIVCFITPSSFLTSPGFRGMREHIRRNVSEGWIIDCTPEGLRPAVPTRIFPKVQHPLAISIFVRKPDEDSTVPATIHYRALKGLQKSKFQQLADVDLDDDGWQHVREGWTAPLTGASSSGWDEYPSFDDLVPWVSPGVTSNRNWVFAPSVETLQSRWHGLVACTEPIRKAELFKKSRDSSLEKSRVPLPGTDTERHTQTPLRDELRQLPTILQIGHRSFDRQYVIADSRLLDMPRPDLWRARIQGQIFAIELHSVPLRSGPGVVFSDLIPSNGYFKGSEGGRTGPMLHPDGSLNAAPGLLELLNSDLSDGKPENSLFPYMAGVVSHPGFTQTFSQELKTPGIRIPLTKDPGLWQEANEVGKEVLWLQTYGSAYRDDALGRGRSVLTGTEFTAIYLTGVKSLEDEWTYNAITQTVHFGGGSWGPVLPGAVDYNTGGKKTINAWFSYRKKNPVGLKTSPLDIIAAEKWDPTWSEELAELLTVLNRLTSLEVRQMALLEAITAGPVYSRDELTKAGVQWPTKKNDRQVKRSVAVAEAQGQMF